MDFFHGDYFVTPNHAGSQYTGHGRRGSNSEGRELSFAHDRIPSQTATRESNQTRGDIVPTGEMGLFRGNGTQFNADEPWRISLVTPVDGAEGLARMNRRQRSDLLLLGRDDSGDFAIPVSDDEDDDEDDDDLSWVEPGVHLVLPMRTQGIHRIKPTSDGTLFQADEEDDLEMDDAPMQAPQSPAPNRFRSHEPLSYSVMTASPISVFDERHLSASVLIPDGSDECSDKARDDHEKFSACNPMPRLSGASSGHAGTPHRILPTPSPEFKTGQDPFFGQLNRALAFDENPTAQWLEMENEDDATNASRSGNRRDAAAAFGGGVSPTPSYPLPDDGSACFCLGGYNLLDFLLLPRQSVPPPYHRSSSIRAPTLIKAEEPTERSKAVSRRRRPMEAFGDYGRINEYYRRTEVGM